MPKLGADVDQLDRLAADLDRAAARLEDNASVIERQVRSLWWSGSTADRFAASWASVDRRHLSTVAASLRDTASQIRSQARRQREASSASFSILGSSVSSGSLRSISGYDIIDGIRMIQSIVGLGDDARAAYYATMIGLTNMGMLAHKSGAAFDYFRGAKGGFTTQYGKLAGRAGTVVTGAINATDYALAVKENGWGSSEAAASAFEGTLSTGASMVPAGGLAFEGGMAIGNVMYERTPLGGYFESRVTGGMENDLSSIFAASDSALAAGDFEEAQRLNGLASEVQGRMESETSGYRGLINSVGAVLNPIRWMR